MTKAIRKASRATAIRARLFYSSAKEKAKSVLTDNHGLSHTVEVAGIVIIVVVIIAIIYPIVQGMLENAYGEVNDRVNSLFTPS